MKQELRCANCGISIHWQATLVEGKAYCCLGCTEGGPCLCDYDNLPQAGEPRPMVHRKAYRLGELHQGSAGTGGTE